MLIFQIKLLLQLVHLDLQLNAAFPFKIIRFEKLHLQRVAFLAHCLSFLSEFRLRRPRLQKLHFKLAHFFLKQAYSLPHQLLTSSRVILFLSEFTGKTLFNVGF